MTTLTIQAVYVGGVFKPTVNPNLQDGEAVELQIVRPAMDASRWQRRAAALTRAGNLRMAIHQRRGGQPIELDIPDLIRNLREEQDARIVANHHSD